MKTCKDCDWYIPDKYKEDGEQHDGFCCCPDRDKKNIKGTLPYEMIKQDKDICEYFEERSV
jgi:hypothetical protein